MLCWESVGFERSMSGIGIQHEYHKYYVFFALSVYCFIVCFPAM